MSLVKNIGIGKEYFNPFRYADNANWFKILKEHNLLPTKEILKDDVRVNPGGLFVMKDYKNHKLLIVHATIEKTHYTNTMYFHEDKKQIEIHCNASFRPYIHYLHELYPDSKVRYTLSGIYIDY